MNNIKKARLRAGVSQKEVALTLKVSQPTVSVWESGEKNPTAKNLVELAKLLSCSADYLLGNPDIDSQLSGIQVSVLGTIPAGLPIEAIENVIDFEEVPKDWGRGGKEYFALRLKGDSMSPDYSAGDTVIFLKADTCDTGDECAVMVNGEDATFKKIIRQENGIVLQPLNASYSPTFYSNAEIEDLPVCILGIAVESRRKCGRLGKELP